MNEIEKKLFDRGIIAPSVPVMPELVQPYKCANFCTLNQPVIYFHTGKCTRTVVPDFCVTDTAAFEAILPHIIPYDRDYYLDMKERGTVTRLEWVQANLYLFTDKTQKAAMDAHKAQIADWAAAKEEAQKAFDAYAEEYAKLVEEENKIRLDAARAEDRRRYLEKVREFANGDEEKVKSFFALAEKKYEDYI